MKREIKLEQAKEKLSKLEIETMTMKESSGYQESQIMSNMEEMQGLVDEIDRLEGAYPKDLTVSDHALVRWLERVRGVEITKYRHRILNPKFRKEAKKINGNGEVVVHGFKYVLCDYKVVTVLDANW